MDHWLNQFTQCERGLACIILGFISWLWQDITPYIGLVAGIFGVFLGIHGMWNATVKCIYMIRKNGFFKALFTYDPNNDRYR